MDKENKYRTDNENTGKDSKKSSSKQMKQKDKNNKMPDDEPNTKDIKHPEIDNEDERDREDGSGEMLGGRI